MTGSALAGPIKTLKSALNNFLNSHLSGWALRERLQLIVTFALLPVVLVSLFQGVARARLDITNIHDRLMQSARTVALLLR